MDSYCKTVFDSEKEILREHIGDLVDNAEFQKAFDDKTGEQLKCSTYITIMNAMGFSAVPSPFLHVIIMYSTQNNYSGLMNYLKSYLPRCDNINCVNKLIGTPLILTVRLINLYKTISLINLLNMLIQNGADVNFKQNGSALQISYNLNVSKILIDAGANFKDINSDYSNYAALKIHYNSYWLTNTLSTMLIEKINECDLCFDVNADCLKCCGKVPHFICINCVKFGYYSICPNCNNAYTKIQIPKNDSIDITENISTTAIPQNVDA